MTSHKPLSKKKKKNSGRGFGENTLQTKQQHFPFNNKCTTNFSVNKRRTKQNRGNKNTLGLAEGNGWFVLLRYKLGYCKNKYMYILYRDGYAGRQWVQRSCFNRSFKVS